MPVFYEDTGDHMDGYVQAVRGLYYRECYVVCLFYQEIKLLYYINNDS